MRALLAFCLLLAGWVQAADIVLTGGTVYGSPDLPPLADSVVVIHDKRLASVEQRAGRLVLRQ